MQEPLSPKLTLESQDKYPDCLQMQLEATPVQLGVTDALPSFDLYLTIKFNEHWEPLLGGRVKFGLKGGELRLKMENAEISASSGELSSHILSIAQESQAIGKTIECQILTKSRPENPTWVLQVKTGETVLKGVLQKVKLGTFSVTSKPCRIEASFEIGHPDVYLTDAEGLWRHDISPNQHAILERRLILFLLETKLKPDLSRVQLCYGCESPLKEQEEVSSSIPPDLQALIEQIMAAESEDLRSLAKIAGLNPLTDFAGGNLRGTTLDEVDLAGANLCRTNLRGAELCDAELTDVNLSNANLGGADLSGADLGNADLSHADLHRASLALANLSGANLSGANLREANLTSANLSGAKVNNTRFGKNTGIPSEVILNLKQRGAIFEES